MGYTTKAQGGDSEAVLLLAHGAGAPADSPFMVQLAAALARRGVSVVRMEFPYMQKRREDGRKRPPDRAEKLLTSFRDHIARQREEIGPETPLFIGGKSMGGRMASLLAAEAEDCGSFKGTLCFGYPFHPPGKLDKWRVAHFAHLWCPACVIQGTRDPFGKPEEIRERLEGELPFELHWLQGGNHDFQPLKASGLSQDDLIEEAAELATRFIRRVLECDSPA
ncbi:alpha/beta family hydrolase [Marinobacter sp. SS21]|uniref:alpha/beta family hydrolase n=1 Tax=Marinobacter sp. SS21 TaxID=2979460 RepID=UPI00232A8678|nr:alpha/beta family hydrolase [Marinobacter sp. SS21]MDC0662054.1 alpha/beta fold hydrolase [Marinobacter sp. SS21]